MPKDEQDFDWSVVIARCLAYLCLKNSKYADAQLLEQAGFLERLGLPASDRADLLGSSRESMRVLSSRAKKTKGAKANGNSKRSR